MTKAPLSTSQDPAPALISDEHEIPSAHTSGVKLFLRERAIDGRRDTVPLLLVHGATLASALWDNPAPGWSWMDRLALDGKHVFAIDLRGYGRSSRPATFAAEAMDNPPYARAEDVINDVLDALVFIRQRTGCDRIDLLGGSWGSIVCGKLVAEGAADETVRRLVLYAPLYQEQAARPDWLPDGAQPASFGAYRQVMISDLRARWDAEIPVTDKSLWRPDGVFEALALSCIQDDAAHAWARPDSFRVPSGTLADLDRSFSGHPLYDARNISIPTLLVRGNADPISTDADAAYLFDAIRAETKRYVVIGNGAHFMIGERVMPQVHRVIAGFLSEDF